MSSSNFIVGYVANLFNSLNLDVDLGEQSDPSVAAILRKYRPIITSSYQYTDEYGTGVRTGTTFRCRLAGILKKKTGNFSNHDYVVSLRRLTYHINLLNGWVYVRVVGIDRYQRLLVELIDVITGKSFSEELLSYTSVYITYN